MAKKLTDAERAQLARDWTESTETQQEFCARRGCSPRALRQYVSTYCAGQRPVARARAIIELAVEQLQGLLAALDAEEACRGAQPGRAGVVRAVDLDRHARPAREGAAGSLAHEAVASPECEQNALDVDALLRSVRAEVACRSGTARAEDTNDEPPEAALDAERVELVRDGAAGTVQPDHDEHARPEAQADRSDPEPEQVRPVPLPRPNGGLMSF